MDVVKLLQSMTDEERSEVVKYLSNENNLKDMYSTTPKLGERFWYIDAFLNAYCTTRFSTDLDSKIWDGKLIKTGVCTNREIVEKRAKEEKLSRLLWKFKLENDNVKLDWEDDEQRKWFVVSTPKELYVDMTFNTNVIAGATYFSTEEIAKRAIKEVVEPMLNIEM